MYNDALCDRMKGYENVSRTYLMRRMPVIIRLDGKAFHTFTRGFRKPFDDVLNRSMQNTMLALCRNIQGCVLGYTQSDEITLVLVDYQKLTTDAWFGYGVQKCASVAASMATLYFNIMFNDSILNYYEPTEEACRAHSILWEGKETLTPEEKAILDYMHALKTAQFNGALFDARVFNVPKEEVCNCLLWRQNDATRNSIEMVGHVFLGHKKMIGMSCNQVQDELLSRYNINWNNYPTKYKRGSCCIKRSNGDGSGSWQIDDEIPIFKGEGRKYIDDLIFVGE